MKRRMFAIVCAAAVALAGGSIWTSADARPGGGSSFSGGSSRRSGSQSSGSSRSFGSGSSSSWSSGHSSSSSGDDFGLIALLLSTGFGRIGFAGLVILFIVVSLIMKQQGLKLDWQAGVAEAEERRERLRPLLERIRENDPNFSTVVLEDFLYALYAQAHTLRPGGALERLSAYLKPQARESLASLGAVREVRAIIVGALRYLAVEPFGDVVRLGVEFESNYTEIGEDGQERSFYARESWSLSRAKGVLSRTPERVRVFTCPSCGAPLDSMVGGRCQYCQATVDTGQLDWVVDSITVTSRETRGPLLTGTTEEKGTDLPTVKDTDLQARFADLSRRDPQFAWGQLQARVALIFGAMQTSWSNREWAQARPFVSDNLFQMLAYWIEAYRRERLRNVTEGARIEQIELARISSDKFFDAITVRLFAASLDYTVADADGRVVGGSRSKARRYSEYWTLIRSAGKAGPARTDAVCPSCGAPLRIEMAGTCQYCRAKVTSGEFDWVLSRIEQDEVYEG